MGEATVAMGVGTGGVDMGEAGMEEGVMVAAVVVAEVASEEDGEAEAEAGEEVHNSRFTQILFDFSRSTGPFTVDINHFEVTISRETKVYHHAVVWKDDSFEDQRARRERMIAGFMRRNQDTKMFYDGDKIIYADRELPVTDERSMQVKPTGVVLEWGRIFDPNTPYEDKLQILNSMNTMVNSVLTVDKGQDSDALVCSKRAGAFFPHRRDYLFQIQTGRSAAGWFGFRCSIGLVRTGGNPEDLKLTLCLNAATGLAIGGDGRGDAYSLQKYMEDLLGKPLRHFDCRDEDRLNHHPAMRRLGLICKAKQKKHHFKAFEPSNPYYKAGENKFSRPPPEEGEMTVCEYFNQLRADPKYHHLGIPEIHPEDDLVRMHSGKRDVFVPLKCCSVDPFQCLA
eukprot:Cvel_17330.t1-p1 / transcript=Cvel_17330.t1 / gene=Cvel_17330 / organism=Chromera_velia_CCMP2878 / gene_product=hypothetical protein / transcript_product=hypothetical protein / location=Cvel_scaffold1377:407-2372(-) / protein_length=395 / sequence_SO=supercontig / SO=protein_coding / is_pseudo=false